MIGLEIINELEREYGKLTDVPKDHPQLIKLKKLHKSNSDKEDKQQKKKSPASTDKLIPWNRINTKAIYNLRKEKGIPLYKMAELLNTSSSEYNQMEKGLARMKESQFTKIVTISNVDRHHLLKSRNERTNG